MAEEAIDNQGKVLCDWCSGTGHMDTEVQCEYCKGLGYYELA